MTGQKILDVCGLNKHFGGVRALDGLDIHLCEGELVGLIGPNGAGKTALLNTITGFYRATSGSIRLMGHEVTTASMHEIGRRGVGRTFQNIRLFRRMTVLENVLVAAKAFAADPWRSMLSFGTSRAALGDAMEWLEMLHLGDQADRAASSLSYGDARRLEIARAMAGRPKLLLLDEPAAGMNEMETQRLVDDIRVVARHVPSILLIEHDMNLIRQLSDRVIAMDFGRKIAEGQSDEVLRHPEVLKAYLGDDAEEAA